jgi:hypothetical protein
LALPAWLASIVQVPAPVKLTVAPEIVHTAWAAGAIVNTTGLPDPPPAAVTVYVEPPTVALLGGVEVSSIA